MSIRRFLQVLTVATLIVVAFTSLTPSKVSAYTGYPLPNFELPYYANMGPSWSGGPHQWSHGSTTEFMDLNGGSGMDFAYAGQSFAVAAMAEGDVIWASETSTAGGLGIKVAVKHTVGGSVVIYGHLSNIWQPILDAVAAGQTYHVLPGYTIGDSGSTGTTDGKVHLHVELRDGSQGCCSSTQMGGNFLSWNSVIVNGYRIYNYLPNELGIPPYCKPGNCEPVAYNYDGVAIKETGDNSNWPVPYETFSFRDWFSGPMRTGVYTYLPSNFVCNGVEPTSSPYAGQQNCELSTARSDVQFSGNGRFGGGGGILTSDLSVPSNQPQPSAGGSAGEQTGNSHVDLRANANYAGTQYGWDNPSGGWFNLSPDVNYLDNQASSIEIDSGWSIMVAEGQNGTGLKKCFVTSYPELSGAYYDTGSPITDTISSVWVYHDSNCGSQYRGMEPGDTVTVWVDPNYSNTHYGWHDPFNGNVESYVSNGITSIGITPGWSAVVYENSSLGGGFACFNVSMLDITNEVTNTGTPVNDNIESIEIFHDSNCGGRMHSPTVTFDASVTDMSIKQITAPLTWSGAAPGWQHYDFGDGQTYDVQGGSGNVSPTHQYANFGTYNVVATVYGTDGIGYPYTKTVNVIPPPPTYSVTINSAHTGSGLVDFTVNWSGALADWHHIDFGDGQGFDVQGASGSQNATHIYNPGTYTLSFAVKGLDSQVFTDSESINMPIPTLSLTINSVDQVSGLVNYTAAWANAPIDSWQRISFGQEDYYVDYQGTSDTKVDSHTYPPGTYTMTFAVNGRTGQVYTTTQQIVVTGPPTATPVPPTATPTPLPPTATFTPVPPTATATPPTFSLTIISVDQTTGLVTYRVVWSNALNDWQHMDFGHDGAYVDYQGASGDITDTHIVNPGTYTFTFTVKGLDSQNYQTTQSITKN